MAGALEGIRVLDMGRVLAGPSSAALMGDMGAEVIKLEQPGRGDDSRGFAPMKNGVSCYYKNFNRSKKGITLDLKTGKDVFLELVKTVDVLVENFRPGTMKKLGLGYEELKKNNPGVDLSNHPARYALVELENIHDPAQVFEPIHRVIFKTEPKKLLAALETACAGAEGFPVKWYAGEESGTIVLDKNKGELAVGILQHFLDDYLKENAGEIDYIHDDDALIGFAKQENAIGFLLPAMEKSQLFRGVIADGVLPRKTFSMGHSREKRYYLEGRKIK